MTVTVAPQELLTMKQLRGTVCPPELDRCLWESLVLTIWHPTACYFGSSVLPVTLTCTCSRYSSFVLLLRIATLVRSPSLSIWNSFPLSPAVMRKENGGPFWGVSLSVTMSFSTLLPTGDPSCTGTARHRLAASVQLPIPCEILYA